MIYLGIINEVEEINNYVNENKIDKVYVLGSGLNVKNAINISRPDIVQYDNYNMLRSQVKEQDLIVINNILSSSKRTDLTYNCIRQYVVQTRHRMIFQKYPFNNTEKDLAVLYDFLQNNPFNTIPWEDIDIWPFIEKCELPELTMKIEKITLPEDKVRKYEKEKEKIFSSLKGSLSVLPKQCLRASQKLNPLGDDKSIFNPNGHYYETQLGVDKYFCDILRSKAKVLEKYNACKDIYW